MTTPKQLLFIDDDAPFLATLKELFDVMSGGAWKIFTATTHAQALELLQKEHVHLVVLDIGMPVMDGFTFLRLLMRAHPGQQVVMLTGHATEANRKECAEKGVVLLLEKPVNSEGFTAVFTALKTLTSTATQSGFRGMMRQVGLGEVLQMECLGRKSSVLQIFTGNVRGSIYISDGGIIHAEAGTIQGEAALYGLLGLKDGDFNLQPFSEPARRTIEGPWEFLLMEAARLTDEGGTTFPPADAASTAKPTEPLPESMETVPVAPSFSIGAPIPSMSAGRQASPETGTTIEEVLLCSGAGEVLHTWECPDLNKRLQLLEQVDQQVLEISMLAGMGRFERIDLTTPENRIICQIQPDRRLLVRVRSDPFQKP